jgi:hypothetical protein
MHQNNFFKKLFLKLVYQIKIIQNIKQLNILEMQINPHFQILIHSTRVIFIFFTRVIFIFFTLLCSPKLRQSALQFYCLVFRFQCNDFVWIRDMTWCMWCCLRLVQYILKCFVDQYLPWFLINLIKKFLEILIKKKL